MQEYKGAIVAITHSRAFAESLHANRVFRISPTDGQLIMADNARLFPSDFQPQDDAAKVTAPFRLSVWFNQQGRWEDKGQRQSRSQSESTSKRGREQSGGVCCSGSGV